MERIKCENSKIASIILILILLAYQILPKELNLIILILILFYYICIKRNKIYINFPGYKIYFTMLFLGMFIGIFNVIINRNNIYNWIKHLYYILLPFLYWEIGMILTASYKLDRKTVCNIIIYATVIYIVYDWINIIINCFTTGINNMTLYEFRNKISVGSFLPIIGFYIIYFYSEEVMLKRTTKAILKYLFLLTIIIHFSRTHLVILGILILFSGFRTNFRKILKLAISTITIFLIVGIIFPSNYSSFISKITNSFKEVRHSNDEWTHKEIVQNWRGYEMYCEIQQFNNANTFEKVFGGGFGRTLEVFGYAYLVSDEDSLAFLHNGYYTQLMTQGIFGVCMYIIWIITLYKVEKRQANIKDRNFLKAISIMFLFTTYFVNGPFYSITQAAFLLYVGIFNELNHIESNLDMNTRDSKFI